MVFPLGGKKLKSQYLSEAQNGCTCSRIRIEQDSLASSLFDLKKQKNLADIWCLVTGQPNEKNIS